ncbi:MAG: polyprenyl synthetase family protein [Saprospiraceae bacterium]
MASLATLLDRISAYGAANPFPAQPARLYEPCSYILSLGGKRMRPALALLGCGLFEDDTDRALPVAWAVELFHNFSLIHDDIMDEAPLRRGQATVHTKWDNTTGILSGDVMLIYAYKALASVSDKSVVPELLDQFNQVAMEVCEGQQLDIDFESRSEVSIPEYLKMIELKTAVLLGASLQMGAVCGGASRTDAERLYEFGKMAGVAFQIQDDLLDTYGDPEKFGKQVGGDILQNKKTLLVLKTLEVASEADRKELAQWMQSGSENPEEKVAAVRELFNRNRIPELIAEEQMRFQQAAFAQLDAVEVAAERKTLLRDTIQALFVRER